MVYYIVKSVQLLNEVLSESNAQIKISFKQNKPEKFRKNNYNGNSYSLFNSFRGQPAPISLLAGRASPSTLEDTIPCWPSYDGGLGISLLRSPELQKACRR
jgi:hypothetical protein